MYYAVVAKDPDTPGDLFFSPKPHNEGWYWSPTSKLAHQFSCATDAEVMLMVLAPSLPLRVKGRVVRLVEVMKLEIEELT